MSSSYNTTDRVVDEVSTSLMGEVDPLGEYDFANSSDKNNTVLLKNIRGKEQKRASKLSSR